MKWLRHKCAWAKENPLFWCNLLFIAGTCVFTFMCQDSSARPLRLWSLFLQLVSIAAVWADLSQTAGKFGKAGFLRNVVNWLKQFSAKGEMSVNAVMPPLRVLATVRTALKEVPPGNSLDERVAALESNVKILDKELSGLIQAVAANANNLRDKIDAESAKRDEAIEAVRKDLEEATIGNRALLSFGAWWLAVGVVLGAIA